MNRKDYFDKAKRVVVKVGSNVLTADRGLNLDIVRAISRQVCQLIDSGLQVILVSSGAMAAGMKKIGLPRRPVEIPQRQAVSAVGQAGLIMEYENAFDRYGIQVAQVLLTSDGLVNRKRYLNARNTLYTLLDWGVVPIINENDTVAVESIQFGDNDNLAAIVTLLMDADILVNLTDIEGLYDKDPRTHVDARLIEEVSNFKKEIEDYASDIPGALGRGGMLSKIKAARKVTAAGTPMVITNGAVRDILPRLFRHENHGTFFVPKKGRLPSRKCWIGYSLKPEGEIKLDAGAVDAIVKRGKSLLPGGITGVTGDFSVGAPVEFQDADGTPLGIGLVNYRASHIRKIMGLRSDEIEEQLGQKTYDEVIHRDNLVVTSH